MAKIIVVKPDWSEGYDAPKVSVESLDAGGNYVSAALKKGGTGTLGNTIIE